MGENKSKQLKIINFQNIQAAHTTEYQENTGRTPNDINQSKILYDPHPRVTEIKT